MNHDGILIRCAGPDDETAISTLLRASYSRLLRPHYNADLLAHALPIITKANPRLLAAGTFYVAETAAGSALACGGWSPGRPGTGNVHAGETHIRHFATHPDWVRCGLGSAILARCIDAARAHGASRVTCYSSLSAEDFYRANGFTMEARFDAMLGGTVPFPSSMMARALT